MYPAIALLAARAIGDRIRSFAEPSDIESIEKARPPWWRPKEIVKRVGVSVAIFDVTLMLLVKPTYWTDWNARNARLAFIEDIRAIVSPGKRLLPAPEFDPTDAMIFAYRLGREIARKPLLVPALTTISCFDLILRTFQESKHESSLRRKVMESLWSR